MVLNVQITKTVIKVQILNASTAIVDATLISRKYNLKIVKSPSNIRKGIIHLIHY